MMLVMMTVGWQAVRWLALDKHIARSNHACRFGPIGSPEELEAHRARVGALFETTAQRRRDMKESAIAVAVASARAVSPVKQSGVAATRLHGCLDCRRKLLLPRPIR